MLGLLSSVKLRHKSDWPVHGPAGPAGGPILAHTALNNAEVHLNLVRVIRLLGKVCLRERLWDNDIFFNTERRNNAVLNALLPYCCYTNYPIKKEIFFDFCLQSQSPE